MNAIARFVYPAATAALVTVAATGCAPWTRAQLDLAAQAKNGVAIARAAQERHAAVADRLAAAQRARLDEAFDADAVATGPDGLTPEWVVEARKAYAAGLDAQHAQRDAARAAADQAARNLDATEAALDRLIWLQSLQLKYTDPEEYHR